MSVIGQQTGSLLSSAPEVRLMPWNPCICTGSTWAPAVVQGLHSSATAVHSTKQALQTRFASTKECRPPPAMYTVWFDMLLHISHVHVPVSPVANQCSPCQTSHALIPLCS